MCLPFFHEWTRWIVAERRMVGILKSNNEIERFTETYKSRVCHICGKVQEKNYKPMKGELNV